MARLIFLSSFVALLFAGSISGLALQSNDFPQDHPTSLNIQEALLNRLIQLEAEQKEMKAKLGLLDVLEAKVDLLEKEKVDLQEMVEKFRSAAASSKNWAVDRIVASVGDKKEPRSLRDLKTAVDETIPSESAQPNEFAAGRAPVPQSCRDLSLLGHTLGGFYQVQSASNPKKIATVLCDFSNGGNPVETIVGLVDIKTSPVHFYMQRNTNYATTSTVIPWQLARLNIGGAMNLATGVFTAPRDGVYHFHFSAQTRNNDSLFLHLRLNGGYIGIAFAHSQSSYTDTASLDSTLQLKSGDQVDLWLEFGALVDSSDHYSHFTGWLDDEDLQI